MTLTKREIKRLQAALDDFKVKYEGQRDARMKFEADCITLESLLEHTKEENVQLVTQCRVVKHQLKKLREKHTDLIVRFHELEGGKK